MKRAVWKIPYVSPFFFSKKVLEENEEGIKTYVRKTLITQYFFKKKFFVYSGRLWIRVNIKKPMIGLKLGEFSVTKIMGSAIPISMAKKEKVKTKSKTGRIK